MKAALRKITGVAAASATVAATVLIAAPAAHAAGDCWDAGFRAPDAQGKTHEAFYCNNVAPTTAYGWGSYDWPAVGTLTSNPSWFVCMIDTGAPNGEVNGPHPNRWLWTKTDSGTWGWVSDNAVLSETDPVEYCIW